MNRRALRKKHIPTYALDPGELKKKKTTNHKLLNLGYIIVLMGNAEKKMNRFYYNIRIIQKAVRKLLYLTQLDCFFSLCRSPQTIVRTGIWKYFYVNRTKIYNSYTEILDILRICPTHLLIYDIFVPFLLLPFFFCVLFGWEAHINWKSNRKTVSVVILCCLVQFARVLLFAFYRFSKATKPYQHERLQILREYFQLLKFLSFFFVHLKIVVKIAWIWA